MEGLSPLSAVKPRLVCAPATVSAQEELSVASFERVAEMTRARPLGHDDSWTAVAPTHSLADACERDVILKYETVTGQPASTGATLVIAQSTLPT